MILTFIFNFKLIFVFLFILLLKFIRMLRGFFVSYFIDLSWLRRLRFFFSVLTDFTFLLAGILFIWDIFNGFIFLRFFLFIFFVFIFLHKRSLYIVFIIIILDFMNMGLFGEFTSFIWSILVKRLLRVVDLQIRLNFIALELVKLRVWILE